MNWNINIYKQCQPYCNVCIYYCLLINILYVTIRLWLPHVHAMHNSIWRSTYSITSYSVNSGLIEWIKTVPTVGYSTVCLSVSKITQKRVHGFGWKVVCHRCRDMDELINFEPDPDHSSDAGTGLLSTISYRLWNFAALPRLPASCVATRNFTSGKSHIYILAARR